MRMIRVKREFLNLIKAGRKTLEVRVGHPIFRAVRAGDKLLIALRDDRQVVLVKDKRGYSSFEEMLACEDHRLISPEGGGEAELLALLRGIYPADKEALGVIVLEIEAVDG